jgi:hypothetical protein
MVIAALLFSCVAAHAQPTDHDTADRHHDKRAADCAGGTVHIARDVTIVEAWRAFKGSDGKSHFERVGIHGTKGVYYAGKVHVTVFDLGHPSGASLVYGEPDMEIPLHPVPYRETFLILSGSSETITPEGETLHLGPGTMFTSDDVGPPGRRGRTGPCGYVALSLAYKTSPPAAGSGEPSK